MIRWSGKGIVWVIEKEKFRVIGRTITFKEIKAEHGQLLLNRSTNGQTERNDMAKFTCILLIWHTGIKSKSNKRTFMLAKLHGASEMDIQSGLKLTKMNQPDLWTQLYRLLSTMFYCSTSLNLFWMFNMTQWWNMELFFSKISAMRLKREKKQKKSSWTVLFKECLIFLKSMFAKWTNSFMES